MARLATSVADDTSHSHIRLNPLPSTRPWGFSGRLHQTANCASFAGQKFGTQNPSTKFISLRAMSTESARLRSKPKNALRAVVVTLNIRDMVGAKTDTHAFPPRADVWWIWLAFIKHANGTASHLYGCASKTRKPVRFPSSRPIPLPSSAQLEIVQYTVTEAQALPVLALLDHGQIDLSSLKNDAPKAKVLAKRAIMANALGNNATRMWSYIGATAAVDVLPELNDIPALLEALNSELGLDFRDQFANHIGGFDIFDRPPWREEEDPFTVTIFNANAHEPDHTILIGRRDGHKSPLRFHLIATNANSDVIVNRLITMDAGVAEHRMTTPEPVYGCKASFFGVDGETLYEYDQTFIRTVNFGLNAVVKTVQIDDGLTQRARGKGADKARNASHAPRLARTTSTVTADPAPVAERRFSILNHMAAAFADNSKDRWFSRTFDSELGVIAYFNELLGDPAVEAATFVDPFVNDGTIGRLLRLDRIGLPLTVLMSWGKTDPDTGLEQTEEMTQANLEVLENVLERAGPLVGPRLSLRNIVMENGKQAFHDRYLMTQSKAGTSEIYLLSNSLNAMAKNWPFCLSLLSGRASSDAAKYIQELLDGKDATREKPFRTTFAWPDRDAATP
ncbi:VPA1262 family N-terminal domain-containing protein [Novosphingobium sp. ERN07]|uniref:VPA1262 family N-terminal domain-containing protein n=1 Tax=Novosphingobium sp. ERN07 TaxID=2726187 RepID=UPI0014568BCB|nr:VPA1262 family N-terminal domain-containing protein [Novosphingobium sp. ERN07]